MDTVQMRLPEGANELDAVLSQQLLVTAKQAARMCGRSLRTWRAWDSAGWIPQPVRIGRATLWRADELRTWVEAGCPRRADWEAIRAREISLQLGQLNEDRIAGQTRSGAL